MSLDTWIALISLIFSVVTTGVVTWIAFVALVHTAKPRIASTLLSPHELPRDQNVCFRFELRNRGYWYATAPAIDVTVFCNFDPEFAVSRIGYGSRQEITSTEVGLGKRGRKFVKAKGIKLISTDIGEVVQVDVRTPPRRGAYFVSLSAYSENGVSHSNEFMISVK